MLTADQIKDGARLLYDAEGNCAAIPRLSEKYPGMALADAYAVQHCWAEIHVANGARLTGRKIGLTSRAMQIATGMKEPDYGVLLDTKTHSDGCRLPFDRFLTPKIEMELAFVLGEDLIGPNVQVADVMHATRFVQPALEIIDSRTETPRGISDSIADNAGFAGIVLGGRIIRPFDVDVRWIGATFAKNGVIEESGVSAAILGHPAAGIAWLANALAKMGGLKRGDTVLCGSFIRPVPVARGDVFHADYGELGSVSISFV